MRKSSNAKYHQINPTNKKEGEKLLPVIYSDDNDNDDDDLSTPEFNWLACTLGLVCFPFTLFSCYTINEKQEAVILRFGRYEDQVSVPGIHWSNCFGRNIRYVTTTSQTIELPTTKIIDKHGNPLDASAIVTYKFSDAKKTALQVQNPFVFIRDQAQAVLKQVVSRYPYETSDGSPSLKTEAQEVGREMVGILQRRVKVAGATIIAFELNELAYAREIASGMLKRQQAQALIEARKVIVDGAVDIVVDTVSAFKKQGITLSPHDTAHIVTNLLTVICSDKDAGVNMNVNSPQQAQQVVQNVLSTRHLRYTKRNF